MYINVNNTKLIFLYRLPIFKFFVFKTNKQDLKDIVDALNIKNRRQRITYIYNETIKIINMYYSKDLCKFKNNKCFVQRKNNSTTTNGCCRSCRLLTDKGCPTANITCKLLYCKSALGNLKALKLRDIKILKCLSISQRLILKTDFYSTKEEIIDDLYYGFIIYLVRSTFRDFKLFKKTIK